MALKDPFAQECLEAIQAIGPVTARSMFGGCGFYWNGVFFAVIAEPGRLHFKGDGETVAVYEAAGASQWVWDGDPTRGPVAMKYWAPPGEVWKDAEALRDWSALGVAAGLRTAGKKGGGRRKKG